MQAEDGALDKHTKVEQSRARALWPTVQALARRLSDNKYVEPMFSDESLTLFCNSHTFPTKKYANFRFFGFERRNLPASGALAAQVSSTGIRSGVLFPRKPFVSRYGLRLIEATPSSPCFAARPPGTLNTKGASLRKAKKSKVFFANFP